MRKAKILSLVLLFGAVLLLPAHQYWPWSRLKAKPQAPPKLSIDRDPETGKVRVHWTGRGVLKKHSPGDTRFKAVRKRGRKPGIHEIDPTAEQMVFQLQASSSVVSANVVGYVNLSLRPGLSLIANALYYTNNALALWLPTAPDGAQVYKFTDGGGFEVSTFDAVGGGWSNPDLQIPIGTGFYFNNPSSETFTYTSFGEVLQGALVNPLPAGISTKGSLVPQAGSINSTHGIPGEPGDEIRLYRNDGQSTAGYISTFYVSDMTGSSWVPDLVLGVGEGFWIQKQNSQDWVRYFSVN